MSSQSKETTLSLPAENTQAVDQMDKGLDLLRTGWLALQADGWLDEGGIAAASAALDHAITALVPVRNYLNNEMAGPNA